MLGALVGDIVGSRFEWHNIKSKDFELLTYRCTPTDDSIMTLAVAEAILNSSDPDILKKNAVKYMQQLGREYPNAGYGGKFRKWLGEKNPQPYYSFGNGAAMRVSPCGFAATSVNEAKDMAIGVTSVTHNHPEGLKAGEAVAVAIFLARQGKSMLEIRDYITKHYYAIDFTLDQIRPTYNFDVSCQGSVPQAFEAFFESTDFEDAIRNAISIGGDSDTIAAITGSIAEAYYGIPAEIRKRTLTYLDERQLKILTAFENKYPPVSEKKVGEFSIPVERDAAKQVTGDDRATLMESAVSAAESDGIAENSQVQITSQQLFTHLYKGCDILRGPINQDEYKTYLTPILFLKRISDVYDEEYQEALAFSGGDEEYASAEDMHTFLIPEGCHWNDIRNVSQNVGKAITKAMIGIETANPDSLGGGFSSFDEANWTDKTLLTDERLKDLIEHMSKINVGNKNYSADVMGTSYEYLIKQFADLSKKNAGEFYTPRTIVKLMVDLLDPQPGETVYDPACGTGGMLIEAIHHMHNDRLAYGRVFGQEKNLSTSAIARMNLYLHGAKDVQIKQGDTLRNPLFLEKDKLKTFDCVLANPPFGIKEWGSAQFETDQYGRNIWGCPPDSSADYAWLQHMVKSMDKSNGRCAVVLPQGVLFHGGKEGKMREAMIRSDILEAVITLASGVFFNTGVNACILFLKNKKEHSHKGRVCLIDGSKEFVAKRAQNEISPENARNLYNLYKDYADVEEKCKIVTLDDLKKGAFSLSVNTYIKRKVKIAIPPAVVRANYFAALEEVEKAEAELQRLLVEGGYVDE